MESTRNWLSDAKLRVSYGLIGNQNISGGGYASTYGSTIYDRYSFGSPNTASIGAGIITVGNPVLKWETSKQFDIGLDLSLFNNSIEIVADYFRKNIDDMLMQEPQPTTLGFPISLCKCRIYAQCRMGIRCYLSQNMGRSQLYSFRQYFHL